MGWLIDTNVFVAMERRGAERDLSRYGATEDVYISVVTASELLMGVHLADNEARRTRRLAFVEGIVSAIGILDFTLDVARRHAELYAQLTRAGKMIGAHDLMIAATALIHGHKVLTDNVREFRRVDGLDVVEFS
ncbi:MAG: type II toxin-antitoxin system VapC family toxin [Planctomycetes bacterium]|nr:type II toxin-antitoxin system VapC family toxin [Planctomycetota bacterium]